MTLQSTAVLAGWMGVLLATAVAAAPASAQSEIPSTAPPPAGDSSAPAPRSFEELDANGDAAISKDEAAVDPALTQAFGTLDQDADGKLSESEYSAYKPGAGS
ncbi:MAG TPA: EF-hand domain-containing protein [Pseudoxanthomonas sp.]|nr:EF-hand domain-containing protein [Pseudoxanthomonas sp.]